MKVSDPMAHPDLLLWPLRFSFKVCDGFADPYFLILA